MHQVLKLIWDAISRKFGGRQELYEINYAGSQDKVRLQCLRHAQNSGSMKQMMEMVDRDLSDDDINGWTVPHLTNPDDINVLSQILKQP